MYKFAGMLGNKYLNEICKFFYERPQSQPYLDSVSVTLLCSERLLRQRIKKNTFKEVTKGENDNNVAYIISEM